MDTDSLVIARDAGQESDNFNVWICSQRLQRERAVLAATPAQKNVLSRHPNRSLAKPIAPFSATIPRLVMITGQSSMMIP